MTLNVSIPSFDCYVRAPFLYNGDLARDGEVVKARAFGIASIQGRALGFHVMDELGAVTWRLPIHALTSEAGILRGRVTSPSTPLLPPMGTARSHVARPLDHLQLWDCFSYEVSVTTFEYLAGRACRLLLKDRSQCDARYMFTVDWYGNEYAEGAGDSGHKCAHILELDCGCYAAQPNNRILWADPATISKPFAVVPDYRTNTRTWSVEGTSKWATPDTNRAFLQDVVRGAKVVVGPPVAMPTFVAAGTKLTVEKDVWLIPGDGGPPPTADAISRLDWRDPNAPFVRAGTTLVVTSNSWLFEAAAGFVYTPENCKGMPKTLKRPLPTRPRGKRRS